MNFMVGFSLTLSLQLGVWAVSLGVTHNSALLFLAGNGLLLVFMLLLTTELERRRP
jgi:hypothetical protein